MVSIHRELKTLFVFPNGEGGFVVKTISPDGEQLVFPLDFQRALTLLNQTATAVRGLAETIAPAIRPGSGVEAEE